MATVIVASVILPTFGLGLSIRGSRLRRLVAVFGAAAHLAAVLAVLLSGAEGSRLAAGFLAVATSLAGLFGGMAFRIAPLIRRRRTTAIIAAGAVAAPLVLATALAQTTASAARDLALHERTARDLAILARTFEGVAQHLSPEDHARLRNQIWLPAAMAMRNSDNSLHQLPRSFSAEYP